MLSYNVDLNKLILQKTSQCKLNAKITLVFMVSVRLISTSISPLDFLYDSYHYVTIWNCKGCPC